MNRIPFRIGHGFDIHRFTPNKPLILGGVHIPYEQGMLAHSDGDVLIHALMDALLGAVALGDIGQHFPDTDACYVNANSVELLKKVMKLILKQGYEVENMDATILAEKPKLMGHLPQMREKIAEVLQISIQHVNIKATTLERLGELGAGKGIAAHVVVLLGTCTK